MTDTTPLSKTAHPAGSSVCINGDRVYGSFADEHQATAVALMLKRRCSSSNVTIFDENSGVHYCVGLPRDEMPRAKSHH
jgi:hypothetical protein